MQCVEFDRSIGCEEKNPNAVLSCPVEGGNFRCLVLFTRPNVSHSLTQMTGCAICANARCDLPSLPAASGLMPSEWECDVFKPWRPTLLAASVSQTVPNQAVEVGIRFTLRRSPA